MKLNWNFLGGRVGCKRTKPSVGQSVWIFPGTAHCLLANQEKNLTILHKMASSKLKRTSLNNLGLLLVS